MSRENLLYSHSQIASYRLWPSGANGILVVNPSLVAQHALLIEHKSLRRARGAEPVGDNLPGVLQDRKREVMAFSIARDLGDGIMLVGVDGEQDDSPGLELTC